MYQEKSQLFSLPGEKKVKWLSGVDSLRFIMAVIVVIGHSSFIPDYTVSNNAGLLAKLLKLIPANMFVGIAAVIVFFVISGLVIHFPFRNGEKIDIYNFYSRRLLRVIIPLFFLFAVCQTFQVNVPNVVWSLYCEIIYYLLYPAIHYVLFIEKIKLNSLITIAFAVAIIVVLFFTNDITIALQQSKDLATNFHSIGHHANWILGLPAWLLGVKIANDYSKNYRKGKLITFNTLVFIRIVVLLYAISSSILRFHYALSYKILFIPFFILLSYVWIKKEVLYYSNREPLGVLESVGKWSYSIYLFHMLFIELFIYMFHPRGFIENIVKILTTLLLCFIMYKLIEEPSHRLIKKLNAK